MIFIAGSREISQKRFVELVKHYNKKDNLTFGFYKEDFIDGFERQIQFKTAKLQNFKTLIEKIQIKLQSTNFNLQFIEYPQIDEEKILRDLKPKKAVFINGSWKIAFQRRKIFEVIKELQIDYSLKSPFVDEEEAKQFSNSIIQQFNNEKFKIKSEKLIETQSVNTVSTKEKTGISSISRENFELNKGLDKHFLNLAKKAATHSFDYTWQTGAVLVKDGEVVLFGHNRILPYEAWMMHHGASKEHGLGKFAVGINDQNANDSLHAEMDIVSQAMQKGISLSDCELYVTLMPCPNCARMLATLGLRKIVCEGSHSGGYAEELFQNYGVEVGTN